MAISRILRRMNWQSRSGFTPRRSILSPIAVLVGICGGLIVGFSDLPLPTFSMATQSAADELVALVSPDCQIKGNVSITTGERIYHVPGGYFYLDTRIDTMHGERWFCTEAEARAAGWRRSKR